MKKGLFVFLALAAFAGCTASTTSNVVLAASADNNANAVNTLAVGPTTITNQVSFSPQAFNVQFFKLEVMKGIQDTTWVTVFDGDIQGDIVSGVTMGNGSGFSVEAGSYEAVRITYNPMWDMTVSWNISNTNLVFTYTNAPNSATNRVQIIFATANLKDEAAKYVNTNYIYSLTTPIEFKGGKSYKLDLVFGTRDILKVWYVTNSTSPISYRLDVPALNLNLAE